MQTKRRQREAKEQARGQVVKKPEIVVAKTLSLYIITVTV